MNIQLLKRLYSIYSPSGKEQKMVKFLCSYIRQLSGNISVSKDEFGNLYVVKGEAESYPCLVSHIDQVSHCKHSRILRQWRQGKSYSVIRQGTGGLRIWEPMIKMECSSVLNA